MSDQIKERWYFLSLRQLLRKASTIRNAKRIFKQVADECPFVERTKGKSNRPVVHLDNLHGFFKWLTDSDIGYTSRFEFYRYIRGYMQKRFAVELLPVGYAKKTVQYHPSYYRLRTLLAIGGKELIGFQDNAGICIMSYRVFSTYLSFTLLHQFSIDKIHDEIRLNFSKLQPNDRT